MPSLTFNVQLKAVRLLRQAEVVMYDDLGAQVSLDRPGKTVSNLITIGFVFLS